MNTLDTFYVPRPRDDEREGDKYLAFTLTNDWVAIDGEKLLMPVEVTERNGQTFDEPRRGLLSQYGGHKLLNQLLLELDSPPKVGDEFLLEYDEMRGFVLRSV
jgi:hypothetical protein